MPYVFTQLPSPNLISSINIVYLIIKIRNLRTLACFCILNSLESKKEYLSSRQQAVQSSLAVQQTVSREVNRNYHEIWKWTQIFYLYEVCTPCLKFASCIFNITFSSEMDGLQPLVFTSPKSHCKGSLSLSFISCSSYIGPLRSSGQLVYRLQRTLICPMLHPPHCFL